MTSSMLNKFGYIDFFNNHSEEEIKEAQKYLRKETVKAYKRINIKHYLARRRLKKS